MALSAQEQQDVQDAVASVHGGSGNSANAAIQQYLTNKGWDPQKVAALSTDGISGNNNFTGSVPSGTWASQIQSALGNYASATDPANVPNSAADANANAVANGGTATTEQQLQNLFQPTYMQQPTQGQATTYGGTQVGPASTLSQSFLNSLDPSAQIQQIYANLNPQFQRATGALNNQLAASGIEGGSAIDAQQQLQSAQSGTIAQAIQAAMQNANSNQLNAGQFNANALNAQNTAQAGYNQQTGLANTEATNQFNLQNLQNLYSTNAYNTQVANAGQAGYAQSLLGQYNTDATNYNGLNTAQFGNQTNLGYQQNAQNSAMNQNLAGNYQQQTGSGAGVSSIFGQAGSAYQNYLANQQASQQLGQQGQQYANGQLQYQQGPGLDYSQINYGGQALPGTATSAFAPQSNAQYQRPSVPGSSAY